MEKISNAKFVVRIIIAAVAMGAVGFVCGYFGPVVLLPDPGIGMLTGCFTGPFGILIGLAAALYDNVAARSDREYWSRMMLVAAIFAAVILIVVVSQ